MTALRVVGVGAALAGGLISQHEMTEGWKTVDELRYEVTVCADEVLPDDLFHNVILLGDDELDKRCGNFLASFNTSLAERKELAAEGYNVRSKRLKIISADALLADQERYVRDLKIKRGVGKVALAVGGTAAVYTVGAILAAGATGLRRGIDHLRNTNTAVESADSTN